MENLSKSRAEAILNLCRGKKVAVIGDIMLDRYFWGSVTRISPESPVPVVDVEEESFHLGGAANVANNLSSLGMKPLLCGIVGDDSTGKVFIDLSEQKGIGCSGIYIDKSRPTTVKTRIIGNNQQIVRLDREVRTVIDEKGKNFILSALAQSDSLSGIIFEDYNKGTISKQLIAEILEFAEDRKIPVFVDPKFENFFEYKGTTVFKPNRKEAQQALQQSIKTEDEIKLAGKELLRRLECKNILFTLGKDGMMLFGEDANISSVPTRARHVADVSGAGDTAIATLAAGIAGGATVGEAASLANFASGVVCEKPGIVSITPEDLLRAIEINHSDN